MDKPARRVAVGTLIALIIAASSALGVNLLRERVDRARQVQTHVERVRTATTADATIQLLGGANPALSALLAGQRRSNAEGLDESLDQLRRLSADEQMAAAVADAARTFMRAIADRGGDPTTLDNLTASLPYLTWFELDRVLVAADAAADREARSAARVATAGTWGIMVLSAVLIALLVVRFSSERRRSESLAARAARDSLTGLANHATWHLALRRAVADSREHGAPLAVVVLDVDHFKRVNDTHGHQMGDAVLREVAQRLLGVTRVGDFVGRIGGEEFAWLLPKTDRDSAVLAAERARHAVADAPTETSIRVTISAGVAELTGAMDPDALLREADRALYRAKAEGRDRVCVATEVCDEGSSDGRSTSRVARSTGTP